MSDFKTYWKWDDGTVRVSICTQGWTDNPPFGVTVSPSKALYGNVCQCFFREYDEAFSFAARMARVFGDVEEVS